MGPVQDDLNPNLLENMIRQRKLMGAFTGGLPPEAQPQSNVPQPDLTVHVHHALGLPDSSPTVPGEPQTMQTGVDPGPTPITPGASAPKIGPIDPNSANPAESAYKQSLMNEPMKADYHPSKLRKVLSAVAGGAEGFFGGPQAGMQLHESLRNGPYDEQHQDWAQYSGNKEKLATEEAAGNTTSGKEALTQAQINEQNSLAGLHRHETNTYHPVTAQEAIDQEQGKLKTDTREAKMLDGTIKHLVQRNGLFYDPETNARVDRSAIEDISDEGKSLKDTKAARIPANLQASVDARKIMAAGIGGKTDDGITVDQPTLDAAKEYVKKLDDGQDPKGAYDDIVKTMETEKGRKLTSSEKIKLESTLHPPAAGPVMISPPDSTGSRTVLSAKPGAKLPAGVESTAGVNNANTDTTQTRQMAETAPHVIGLLDKIDKEIDENVKDLGPAAGRWNEFMTGKVGEANPKFAKLRTDVALAKTLIMRAHLGARGGQAMYEHFNNMLDLAGSDPQNLHAATGAIRDYMADVAKGSHNNTPVEEYVRDPKSGKLVLAPKTGQ